MDKTCFTFNETRIKHVLHSTRHGYNMFYIQRDTDKMFVFRIALTDVALLAGPAWLTVAGEVPEQVLTGERIDTRTAAALVGVELAVGALPALGAPAHVRVVPVHAATPMEARSPRTVVNVCGENKE